MDLEALLCDGPDTFLAGIAVVDIVGCSRLTRDRLVTFDLFQQLILDLISGTRIAALGFEGDGAKLVTDANTGLDPILRFCERLTGLLPTFNIAQDASGRDRIQIRVVCHSGHLNKLPADSTQQPTRPVVEGDALNDVSKYERDVGRPDQVVVTDSFLAHISDRTKHRFGASHTTHSKLGPCYILDPNKSHVTLELHEKTSQDLLEWITASVGESDFDELDLFAYTNETLTRDLERLSRKSDVRIRVVARSWLTEGTEETHSGAFPAEPSNVPRTASSAPWKKSNIIRSMADLLLGSRQTSDDTNLSARFYDEPPVLKGAILRNTATGRSAAHIGFYAWRPGREGGGSPYVGERWTGSWLHDDATTSSSGPQSVLLDAVQSRFDRLWAVGHTYDYLKQEQAARNERSLRQDRAKKIWNIDGRPYCLVIPGRNVNRPLPFVATEDLMTMRTVENFLVDQHANVEIKHIDVSGSPLHDTGFHQSATSEQPSTDEPTLVDHNARVFREIDRFKGHLVYICRRTLHVELRQHLEMNGFPFSFSDDAFESEGSPVTVCHVPHGTKYFSPMDSESKEKRDYCVVGKCRRNGGSGNIYVIAGIHGMGTWSGAQFLTDPDHLMDLFNAVQSQDFAKLIVCEFDSFYHIKQISGVTDAETMRGRATTVDPAPSFHQAGKPEFDPGSASRDSLSDARDT